MRFRHIDDFFVPFEHIFPQRHTADVHWAARQVAPPGLEGVKGVQHVIGLLDRRPGIAVLHQCVDSHLQFIGCNQFPRFIGYGHLCDLGFVGNAEPVITGRFDFRLFVEVEPSVNCHGQAFTSRRFHPRPQIILFAAHGVEALSDVVAGHSQALIAAIHGYSLTVKNLVAMRVDQGTLTFW